MSGGQLALVMAEVTTTNHCGQNTVNLLEEKYRIAGIFRGVIFSWFSWSRGEPRNIYPRKTVRAPKIGVANHATTKFFPRNSQNYDFHENITPRKIPAIRYIER